MEVDCNWGQLFQLLSLCVGKMACKKIVKKTTPQLHTHCRVCSTVLAKATTWIVWSCRLKRCFASASAVKGVSNRTFGFSLVPGYAMLMRPNKTETAVNGCHCLGDMAVRMRKVLAIRGVVSCDP